jgi:hypothetical protein
MPYLGPAPSTAAAGTISASATVGDGTAEDTKIVFDGNTLDFRMGIDDGTDTLEIGKGNAHGTTAHMIFDTNGIIRAPLQPAFSVKPATTQLNISGLTTITFGTEQFDTNADYNTGTYTFTAPVDGYYQMNLLIKYHNADAAASYHETQITASNGNVYIDLTGAVLSADGFIQQNGSTVIFMDAADTAYAQVTVSGGTAQADIDAGESFFSGFLVG